MKKKTIIAMMLAVVMCCSQVLTVSATTDENIAETQQNIADTQAMQDNLQNSINDIEEQKNVVLGEIDSLDAQLITTIASINTLNQEIENTTIALEQTTENLAAAEATKAEEYEAMKKRIQYIYEKGGDAGWAVVLLEEDNIMDFLNQAEYTQSMYEYDRQCLAEYAQTVEEVTSLQHTQALQKADLEAAKIGEEEEEAHLQILLDEKRATCDNFDLELADANEKAILYQALLEQQTAELQQLHEQKAAEEEAARQAAAAAAQAAAEEAARQAAAAAVAAAQQSSSGSSYDEPSYDDGGSSYVPSYSAPSGDVSLGEAIVAYADQFLGNPYVWGGNSLTNGIDCSHFVWQVLMACGAYSGGYTTSAGWRSLGSPVSSLSEAQAGDVICYSGHVAIYDGYGGIVEAKGSEWGITHDRSAAHTTILAIRRFV